MIKYAKIIIMILSALLGLSFLSLGYCHILFSDGYFPIDFGKWFWINTFTSLAFLLIWNLIERFEINK